MKRRVRVYKSGGEQGGYLNPTAQFLQRAQVGAEQQGQADPQQIISQVAGLVAPPPYGEGQDPNEIYKTLAQSYGQDVASQIINAAAAYVQQMVGEEDNSNSQMQEAPANDYNDLTAQEDIIQQEQRRQQDMYNNAAVAEDETFYDDLLNSELPQSEETEQKRLGGAKKKFVKQAMTLAKKALGDAGNSQNGKADPTDVLNGRQQKSSDFLSTIQNQAALATMQKQAENIAETIFKPTPQFQQEGGYTGQDIYKFVYGGNDPSVPDVGQSMEQMAFGGRRSKWNSALYNEAMDYNQESNPYYVTDINAKRGLFGRLKNYNMRFAPRPEEQGMSYSASYSAPYSAPDATPAQGSVPMFTGSNMVPPRMPKAQAGLQQVRSLTNDLNTNKRGITSFVQGANLNNTSSNEAVYNYLKSQGVNVGDYRSGIDYSKYSPGKSGNQSYDMNQYKTGTFLDALLPNNGIWNTTYTVNGTNMGMINPKDFLKQGFNMDKERLGFGHKRYTFTPAGSDAVTAQNKDQLKQEQQDSGDFMNKMRQVFQKNDSSRERDRSPWLRNFVDQVRGNRMGMSIDKQQYGGLPSYQGNTTGSSVNTQEQLIEFKPKTSKEVWGQVYPELKKQYGIEDPNMDIVSPDPSLTIDEQKELNGENFLNIFNPAMRAVTKGINIYGQRGNNQMFQDNTTADNLVPGVDPQFRGNYNPNSGLFREDQMGQLWQSKEGGERRKTGQQNNWGLGIFPTAMGGADIDQYMGKPKPEVQDSLKAVPREEANLEAEGGETAFGDINGDGFPEHMKIVGPRHTNGGVPLNLPDDTFIFSDTRSMKISDPKILKMFGKPEKKGGYTPAELAKPYDINKYRKILDDPESDIIDRKTAEQMIKNFNIKLGALALAQESKKAFPQGIPVVARPYMEMMGLKDEDIIPQQEEAQNPAMMQQGMMSGEEQPQMSPDEMAMMQQTGEMGMPPVDQMAMGQEDMSGVPMAAYGMSMGGYGMPFAQDGFSTYTDYVNEQPMSPNMSERDMRISQKPYYHMEPQSPTNPDADNYWLTPGDRFRNLRSFITGEEPGMRSGVSYQLQEGGEGNVKWLDPYNRPQEEIDAANEAYFEKIKNIDPKLFKTKGVPYADEEWYNMGLSPNALRDYNHSFVNGQYVVPRESESWIRYQDGGELDMYQSKGEVKSKNKTYKESELPEDAVVKSPYSTDIRIGDFVKQSDGSYLKVTKANFKATEVDTKTRPGTASDFYNKSAENKAIMDEANAIIEREIAKGTIKKMGANKINILGTLNIPFKEQIALSRAFNSNAEFGTNKYKIASQKSTPGYSAGPGKGSFVSGFNPEIYEQRYIFEKARGQGATDDQAYAEVERVLADPKAKAKLRREYVAFLGLKDVPTDDAELLKSDFYKNRYGEVTKGLENVLAKSSNRPALGDDLWSGYEHFDALGLSPDLAYEGLPEEKKEDVKDKNDIDQDEEVTTPYRGDAPWWLQDQIKIAGAFGDLMSINKYYPWAPKYNPLVPEPAFLDPTRSIAAQSEQAKILGDSMAQFSSSAPLAAGRLSGLQGQLAKNVADTTNTYDTANVQIANQFAPVITDTYNKAQMYNQGVSKQLYDANTIMNQQYDNSKRALRNNLLNQYTSGITNRWKTDALNQIYPQFQVDPSVGGRMHYSGKSKAFRPEASKSLADLYEEYYDATGDREAAQKFAMLQYKQNQSGYDNADMYPAEAMMSLYSNMKDGGIFVMGPSLLPPILL